MGTVTLAQVERHAAPADFGIAWAFIWRGLAAVIGCVMAGAATGMMLGFVVALSVVASRFPSWSEAFAYSSQVLAELLSILPI